MLLHDDELTERELRCIESRSAAAQPGPWFSYVVGRDLEAGLNFIETAEASSIELSGGTVADQDFVAHAREDIPRLVAEIRHLRAAIAKISNSLAERAPG